MNKQPPSRGSLPLRPPIAPMEAKRVERIPEGDGWQFEPKWDGFRAIVFRDGDAVALQSKSGQPLARYFPELTEAFGHFKAKQFVLDGEIVMPVNGRLSFDDLLHRIHPAESRIRTILVHIGHTSSIRKADQKELTKKLEALRGDNPFEARVPGGPSRWATGRSGEWEPVRPWLVCEVEYDYFSQGRFRHGSKFLRWRPDKKPRQCTMDQVSSNAEGRKPNAEMGIALS